MTRNEIMEMARQTVPPAWLDGRCEYLEAFAKLIAEKAVAKDREEFDIDELCARQNKIGYKQGYRAGQLAEREACAKLCEDVPPFYSTPEFCSAVIRKRGEN